MEMADQKVSRPPVGIKTVLHKKVPGYGYKADSPLYAKQEAWRAAEREADCADCRAAALEAWGAKQPTPRMGEALGRSPAAEPCPAPAAAPAPAPAPGPAAADESGWSWSWPFPSRWLDLDYWLNWRWVDEKARWESEARATTPGPEPDAVLATEGAHSQEPELFDGLHDWWLSALIVVLGCCCLAGVAAWSQLGSKPLAVGPPAREDNDPFEGHPGGGLDVQRELPVGYTSANATDVQLDGFAGQPSAGPMSWEATGQYAQQRQRMPPFMAAPSPQDFQRQQLLVDQTVGAVGSDTPLGPLATNDLPPSFNRHQAVQGQTQFSQQR